MVLVHNKTLAAQLYGEFKELFPHNRVEYFISNFDFYQPEAYLPKTDTYIDKQVVMNEEIEMMRASAVNSLLEREDTIVVCSVASIYGLSDPDEYRNLAFTHHVGEPFFPKEIAQKLVLAQYQRNDIDLKPGTFRIRGDVMEIYPPNGDNFFIRVLADFDEIAEIQQIRPTTGELLHTLDYYPFFPAHEHASTNERINRAVKTIQEELVERLKFFDEQGKYLESERLKNRTEHDVEALREFGMCAGVENYARHFDGRKEGKSYLSADTSSAYVEKRERLPTRYSITFRKISCSSSMRVMSLSLKLEACITETAQEKKHWLNTDSDSHLR